MNAEKLKDIISKNKLWLTGAPDGERADLGGANLRGANLRGANLGGANLGGADGIIAIGPIGSRSDMLYAVYHDNTAFIKTGCFWGTIWDFQDAVNKTHGANQHGLIYQMAIALIIEWYNGIQTSQRSEE